ncbi:hypothetical protein EST38_g11885 [Candolleomyces aberdarensis]|uniref:Uncharacterized protein n=1 Tax=Candolleomyces aberdarensis TaxID=2316362 RepID=A0A4Q2D6E6_9AGAR|nr:hypothetical protein EST38_g11885 [Candolleomyces aberdarensis]
MTSVISHFPALATTSLVLPLPVTMEDLVFLNRVSGLRRLSLSSGQGPRPQFPRIENYLGEYSKEQGKATVADMDMAGHGRVIFYYVAFLSSPSLRSIACKLLRQDDSDDCAYIVPYVLHRLSHTAPELREIHFERLEPEPEKEYIQWYENNGVLQPPDAYIQDLPRLRNLTGLCFKYIPFLDRSFSVQLVAQLPNFPHLKTLCLLPLPGSKAARHKLELPTLECLQALSSTNLALKHVTISLDMSVIPSNIPDLSLPGHALEELFIQPYYHNPRLPVSTLVTLSTYLDHLFPRISDITSFFEEAAEDGPCSASPRIAMAAALALPLWEDVAYMMNSYQVLREKVDTLVRTSMCVEH